MISSMSTSSCAIAGRQTPAVANIASAVRSVIFKNEWWNTLAIIFLQNNQIAPASLLAGPASLMSERISVSRGHLQR
jgi:hypothetical protein